MYLDSRLRELLWKHEGFVLTHPPKTAGTSVKAAVRDHRGFISLERVILSKLEHSVRLRREFDRELDRLRDDLTSGQPWIMHIGHQSFADRWHLDLPPRSVVVIPYRTTQDRLRSWISYIGKTIEWAEGASFEVTSDLRFRHFNADQRPPSFSGGHEWKSESLWEGDESNAERFVDWVRIKIDAQRIRGQIRNDVSAMIQNVTDSKGFYFRDLFPRDFLRSTTFRRRTQVVHFMDLADYLDQMFEVRLPQFNTSRDFDVHGFTGQDESGLNRVLERFALPDRETERILLARRWTP